MGAAKHYVLEGNLETAQLSLSRLGGQLFPARDSDGPFVHVHGSNVFTYWPAHSKRRGYTMELARRLGVDPETSTTSRLIKHVIEEEIRLDYKSTFFCEKWRALAKKGSHWHYLHCVPGNYEYCIEIDLKSAYWTAFCGMPSMLLSQHKEWQDDKGALLKLKEIVTPLPKPFRLALIGTLASWRHSYWVKDKEDLSGESIRIREKHEVKYGAAFNASHRAILHVYKLMKSIHSLTGEDCLRIHTDGVILNCMNGMKWEKDLDKLIKSQGFDYTIKGNGQTWLIDVNTGVIGKKVMGARHVVIEGAKEAGIKINLNAPAPSMKIFKVDESPTSEPPEVCMNPGGVETQTSLPFLVD